MRARIIGVCALGWVVTAGVLWSVEVYGLDLLVAAALAVIPWVLAAAALGLLVRTTTDVSVDISKIALQGALRSEHFEPGQAVIRQGDAAEHFYIITRGRARVLVDDDEYSRIAVGELVAGQFFGEAGLLTGERRNATVEASEPLDVLVMDQSAFAQLIGAAGETSEHIRRVAAQRSRRA